MDKKELAEALREHAKTAQPRAWLQKEDDKELGSREERLWAELADKLDPAEPKPSPGEMVQCTHCRLWHWPGDKPADPPSNECHEHPVDKLVITRATNQHVGGTPALDLEVTCQACGAKWTYVHPSRADYLKG